MTKSVYNLVEAGELLGKNRRTLLRWVEAGKLQAIQSEYQGRLQYLISVESIEAFLKSEAPDVNDYENLFKKWLFEQRTGLHTGKPMSEKGIEANEYGMGLFWRFLDLLPSTGLVTPESLREALSKVPIDHQNKNCHFSMRDHIYKAVRSFIKYLVRHGRREKTELEELIELKPRRVYSAKKTVANVEEVKILLEANESWQEGRTTQDRQLVRTLVMLFAFAGLRKEEAIRIRVEDFDLDKGILYVVDGKGGKNRLVGLIPELKSQVSIWLEYRPQSNMRNLLLTKMGKPLDERDVSRKIERLCERTDVKVTPHGLRRAFATIMEHSGMPVSMVQLALGHSDIKTTQGYLMTKESQMVDWLKAYGKEKKENLSSDETSLIMELLAK